MNKDIEVLIAHFNQVLTVPDWEKYNQTSKTNLLVYPTNWL